MTLFAMLVGFFYVVGMLLTFFLCLALNPRMFEPMKATFLALTWPLWVAWALIRYITG